MSQMRVYVGKDVASFCRTNDPMGELSNFHNRMPLLVPTATGLIKIDSSETFYQADKFRDHPEIQQGLIDAAWAHNNHPRGGKDHAWAHADEVSEDWQKGRSVRSMRYVLRLKTCQHREAVLGALALAKGKPIVEFSKRDAFWGAVPQADGTLKGFNILGRLWMEIEQELEADPDAYSRVVDPYDTKLLGSPLIRWTQPEPEAPAQSDMFG